MSVTEAEVYAPERPASPEPTVATDEPPAALLGLVVVGAEDAETCSDGICS